MLCSIRFDNDFSTKMNKRYESFLSGHSEEKDEDSQIEYMINQEYLEWYREFCKAWCHERETQREREKAYNPYYIDDPRLRQGARKTVITKLGPMYTFSVIRYANQKTLKNELNEDFAESHPWIPPSLTLSKIRNLKRQTRVLEEARFDLYISTGYCIFLEAVIRKLVIKSNRKLKFATCLLLAGFNESMVSEDDNVNQAINEEQQPARK